MSIAPTASRDPEVQRLAIRGRVWSSSDTGFQEALAAVYGGPERPRCLCMPGGVEMYVAHLRQYVVKRMPNAGNRHHPRCGSFEPEVGQSGLGSMSEGAIRELDTGRTELRVDFAWTKRPGRTVAPDAATESGQVESTARRMSLRALTHFLFERAGFNRAGRANLNTA